MLDPHPLGGPKALVGDLIPYGLEPHAQVREKGLIRPLECRTRAAIIPPPPNIVKPPEEKGWVGMLLLHSFLWSHFLRHEGVMHFLQAWELLYL